MFNTILFLSPHTDDVELGCGGTIAKFIEEGRELSCFVFADATNTNPAYNVKDECMDAMECLGIKFLAFENYKTRELNYKRQNILESLINIKGVVDPDMVFAPSHNDSHQDHQTIAMEATRAFQNCTTLGYEIPWNNAVFRTQNFIVLEKRHIEKKIEALQCYKSQLHRSYFNADYIWGLARMRGMQVGAEYAEAFEVNRWII